MAYFNLYYFPLKSGTCTCIRTLLKHWRMNTWMLWVLYSWANIFQLKLQIEHGYFISLPTENRSTYDKTNINIDFAAAKSEALCNIYSFLKENIKSSNTTLGLQPRDGHVGGQNKRIFPRRIYMKIEFSSQRREMLLFLTTNMAAVTSRANQQQTRRKQRER